MFEYELPFSLEEEPERLRRSLARDGKTVIIEEQGRIFNLSELRRQAFAVAKTLKEQIVLSDDRSFKTKQPHPVGIYLKSPFLLTAAIIGVWGTGMVPVLIDPSSKREIETLQRLLPEIHFLATSDHPPEAPFIALPEPADKEIVPQVPALDAPMVFFFTSGSEGEAKLVLKKGRQIYAHVGAASEMLQLPQGCQTLSFVPLFHILGFSYGLMASLRKEGNFIVLVGATPQAMLKTLLHHQPNVVVASAVHYRYLNAVIEEKASFPEAVYISSGAPLPANVGKKFKQKTGKTITELYGSTETAGIARRQGEQPWTPYPSVHFRIEDGHLWVKSAWADPENPDNWVQTHDIAEEDGEGFCLLGRAGNIIKIGGKRFSTTEVEQAAKRHPKIDDAAAVTYERFGETALALFVVMKKEHSLSTDEIRQFLATQLAAFKMPRTITFLETLPRKKLQKLDYENLRILARQQASHDG